MLLSMMCKDVRQKFATETEMNQLSLAILALSALSQESGASKSSQDMSRPYHPTKSNLDSNVDIQKNREINLPSIQSMFNRH